MTDHASLRPVIAGYPVSDSAFAESLETSLASIGGRPVSDVGVLAAVEALLRESYPLATLRDRLPNAQLALAWEAFRDDAVRDLEMVARAGTGDEAAFREVYDRHHALAYHVAVQVAGESDAAAAAVIAAYRAVLMAAREEVVSVRIRLAIAARRAALTAAPGLARTSRQATARAVVELAHMHSLKRAEIATVLGLARRDVATLANEGLRYLAPRLE